MYVDMVVFISDVLEFCFLMLVVYFVLIDDDIICLICFFKKGNCVNSN